MPVIDSPTVVAFTSPAEMADHVIGLLRAEASHPGEAGLASRADLDEFMTGLADYARWQLFDEAQFPMSADGMQHVIVGTRLMAERVQRYRRIVLPMAVALATGCAWGGPQQDYLWTRMVNTIANTMPMMGGNSALLELRRYPTVMALYAAALGATYGQRYSALRAVTMDAQVRKGGLSVPVTGIASPLAPFASDAAASVIALISNGEQVTDEQIDAVYEGRLPGRRTPAPDILHAHLRAPFAQLIPDDEEYDEVFDAAELLLTLIAVDAKAQAKAQGSTAYLCGGWTGRFVRREQHRAKKSTAEMHARIRSEGAAWAPLGGGLFGGSALRAITALESYANQFSLPLSAW